LLEIPGEAERKNFFLSERSEFKKFSEASGRISSNYFTALIFWFFCIKAKEQREEVSVKRVTFYVEQGLRSGVVIHQSKIILRQNQSTFRLLCKELLRRK
jgi:hypothetical protein